MQVRTIAFGSILLIAGSAMPGAAQTVLTLDSVAQYQGTCERLVIAGADRSAACAGVVTKFSNPSFGPDFGMFTFKTGSTEISFIGKGPAVQPDVGSELAVRSVGIGGSSLPGPGTCNFSTAPNGRASIRCAARTDAGEYSVHFTSNGQPPT